MATAALPAPNWRLRPWAGSVFLALTVAAAVAVLVTHLGQVETASHHPSMWVMTGLAVLAGTQAFTTAVGPHGVPAVVTPTVSFGFAILISWGLGPAIVAQCASVVVVAWRLRQPVADTLMAAARYTLALTAASAVLWLGNPDPFQRAGGANIALDAVAIAGAAVLWLATYGALVYIGDLVAPEGPTRRTITGVRDQVVFKSALLVLSPVLAFAAYINVLLLPLVLIPLYAVQRMARLSADRDRAAQLDPLTGLANRVGLKTAFDRLTATHDGSGRQVSLLILDLDRFKQINDALGHDVGDRLLVAVAGRLAPLAPRDGTVARLGGDEFAFLTTAADPHALAQSVMEAVNAPILLDSLRVDVTASVGIVTRPNDADFAVLMRHADIAMYDAKQHGSGTAVYHPKADRTSPEQLSLLADFRHALETNNDQLDIHYQPQVSLRTGQTEAVEALLRWHHPRHGPISPADIIALAEYTPLMNLVTAYVIDKASQQTAAWYAADVRLRTSVNVSARDLYRDDLIDQLSAALRRHRVEPGLLQLELTESALLADLARAHTPLHRIADLGIGIALDDFGTGYSSLQHLRRLPITEIKIDRTFVAGMGHNSDDTAIVESTIQLAHSLHIRTVAEGVEDDTTRQRLTDAGCDLAQGFHTAPPMPGHHITAWIRTTTDRRSHRAVDEPDRGQNGT